MYSNSKAKVKLLSKISEAMDVLIGTEQGHPMSAELFKCYLIGLSTDLDKTLGVKSPTLSRTSSWLTRINISFLTAALGC